MDRHGRSRKWGRILHNSCGIYLFVGGNPISRVDPRGLDYFLFVPGSPDAPVLGQALQSYAEGMAAQASVDATVTQWGNSTQGCAARCAVGAGEHELVVQGGWKLVGGGIAYLAAPEFSVPITIVGTGIVENYGKYWTAENFAKCMADCAADASTGFACKVK